MITLSQERTRDKGNNCLRKETEEEREYELLIILLFLLCGGLAWPPQKGRMMNIHPEAEPTSNRHNKQQNKTSIATISVISWMACITIHDQIICTDLHMCIFVYISLRQTWQTAQLTWSFPFHPSLVFPARLGKCSARRRNLPRITNQRIINMDIYIFDVIYVVFGVVCIWEGS